MIISHSKKFIFVKTRKTAGSSIEKHLSAYLDPELDYFTGIKDHPNQPNHSFLNGDMYPGVDTHHYALSKIKNLSEYADYYKFTVERNPWQKCISYLEMRKAYRSTTFDTIKNVLPCDYHTYTDPTETTVIVDNIMQYNTLDKDFKEVCELLGIPTIDISTIQEKSQYRKNKLSKASEVFTPEQNDYISEVFAREIQLFGYTQD